MRARANSMAIVCSAAVLVLPSGVFMTTTPAFVALATSMLSTPMPARPTTFRRLAEPFEIAGLRLPNRIVMPAMGTGLPEHDGTCNDATIAYYRRRAEGGVGMITLEASLVSPDAYGVGPELRLHGDQFVPGLRRLVDALRPSGIPVGIQLWHPGRQTLLGEPIAPSPVPSSSR